MSAYSELMGLKCSDLNDQQVMILMHNAQINNKRKFQINCLQSGHGNATIDITPINEEGITWGQ
ncbi:MAG: hypothetical protein ABIG93_03045 [archaeon]|nr:hypothetical protein [Nanoarchaeota archaeon]